MVGSKDLPASTVPFLSVFINNQFRATPVFPQPGTSLAGKTAIITGGNTGLGYAAAVQLLSLSLSTLILAVRSPTSGERAASSLRALHPKATIEVWHLDLALYSSITSFVERLYASPLLPTINYVLLNAGVMKLSYSKNESTGHEECLQINYLSNALLAILLLPVLKAKKPRDAPVHLTIVSAALTLAAKFPNRAADPLFKALDDPVQFHPQETYNTSKVLAHCFLWKLVDYVSADDVVVNLADPAWVKGTDLVRDAKGPAMKAGIKLFGLLGRTPRVGASCLVDGLVGKGKESHGCFLMSWQAHPFTAMLYSPEGKKLTDRVWKETLAEFEFAGVRAILENMKRM